MTYLLPTPEKLIVSELARKYDYDLFTSFEEVWATNPVFQYHYYRRRECVKHEDKIEFYRAALDFNRSGLRQKRLDPEEARQYIERRKAEEAGRQEGSGPDDSPPIQSKDDSSSEDSGEDSTGSVAA